MSDDSKHYEIKNELSSLGSKLNGIDKQVYDIQKNVDLITEWAVVIGVSIAVIAFCLFVIMVVVSVIVSKM